MVRLLRFPGSRNFNGDQLRVTRMDPHVGPDCNVEATCAALVRYERPAPPPRLAGSFGTDASFDEVVEVVDYLTGSGRFDRPHYANMRDLIFALSCIVLERPDLHDAALDLMQRVVDATGRDRAFNESLFSEALSRTPDWIAAGGRAVTSASLFKAAYAAGWLPPHPEDDLSDEQRIMLDRARRRLWSIFGDDYDDSGFVMEKALRMAARLPDEAVRRVLTPSLALHLAREGLGEIALLKVIEFCKGVRDVKLARWALLKGQAHD